MFSRAARILASFPPPSLSALPLWGATARSLAPRAPRPPRLAAGRQELRQLAERGPGRAGREPIGHGVGSVDLKDHGGTRAGEVPRGSDDLERPVQTLPARGSVLQDLTQFGTPGSPQRVQDGERVDALAQV